MGDRRAANGRGHEDGIVRFAICHLIKTTRDRAIGNVVFLGTQQRHVGRDLQGDDLRARGFFGNDKDRLLANGCIGINSNLEAEFSLVINHDQAFGIEHVRATHQGDFLAWHQTLSRDNRFAAFQNRRAALCRSGNDAPGEIGNRGKDTVGMCRSRADSQRRSRDGKRPADGLESHV